MDKVQEIMELVGKYGTAVHENSTGNPSNHTLAHEESAAYDAVKAALRELLERMPISDEKFDNMESAAWSATKDKGKTTREYAKELKRRIEKFHGIGA